MKPMPSNWSKSRRHGRSFDVKSCTKKRCSVWLTTKILNSCGGALWGTWPDGDVVSSEDKFHRLLCTGKALSWLENRIIYGVKIMILKAGINQMRSTQLLESADIVCCSMISIFCIMYFFVVSALRQSWNALKAHKMEGGLRLTCFSSHAGTWD